MSPKPKFLSAGIAHKILSSADRINQVSIDIETYYDLEARLRILIRERKDRVDTLLNRMAARRAKAELEGEQITAPLDDVTGEPLPLNEFSDVFDAAEDAELPELTMSRRQLVAGASEMEALHLAKLDEAIKAERAKLRALEDNIMTYEPKSATDAIIKLRFITALLLNQSQVEQDYLAYLLEECVDGVQATLMQDASATAH